MSVVPNRATYGGIFQARTSQGLDSDLDQIQDLGFVILAVEPKAGQTKVIAHGQASAVNIHLNDFEMKKTLPAKFALLPVGEELTTSLVRRWVAADRVIF